MLLKMKHDLLIDLYFILVLSLWLSCRHILLLEYSDLLSVSSNTVLSAICAMMIIVHY